MKSIQIEIYALEYFSNCFPWFEIQLLQIATAHDELGPLLEYKLKSGFDLVRHDMLKPKVIMGFDSQVAGLKTEEKKHHN